MNKPTGPSFLEKRPLGSTLVRSGEKAGIRNIQVLQQRAGISMLLRYGVATRGTHQDCSLDRRHYPAHCRPTPNAKILPRRCRCEERIVYRKLFLSMLRGLAESSRKK